MVLKVVCVFLAVVAIAHCSIFQKCDNEIEPVSVFVENCNEKHCEVRRDSPSKMELKFKTAQEAKSLTGAASAYIAGFWAPYRLGAGSNVCNNLANGAKCPIAANTEATYVLEVTTPSVAPIGTSTRVQIKVTDHTKKVVACVRFPVVVVA